LSSSVQDTVQALLRATRAHAGLALRPGGLTRLGNFFGLDATADGPPRQDVDVRFRRT